MTRPRNPERLWLFAVEEAAVQVTWGRLGPGRVRFDAADSTVEIDTDGGPGSVILDGLPAATPLELVVTRAHGGARAKDFATLAPPPGRELSRFATISDLHLGERAFGWRSTIVEDRQTTDPFPVRATRAALRELVEWGAELLVVKGDVTTSSRIGQWELFAKLVAEVGVPIEVIPGNHDAGITRHAPPSHRPDWGLVEYGERVSVAEAFARFGLGRADPVRHVDIDGLRLILVDADLPGRHLGRIADHHDAAVELVRTAPRAVAVMLHHQPMPLPIPYYWPPGIPASESRRFLRAARRANPALFVATGHTHRNRSRRMEGVTIAEVGSVKDYPGVWAGYAVHEGGIRQVVRRVAAPDVLAWTDRSARAGFGMWGRWSQGTLADRCFSLPWSHRSGP